MPGGDGTGPMGFGPRTGWGSGSCGGRAVAVRRGDGLRGGRRGRGGGRHGHGNVFRATGQPEWMDAFRGPPESPAPADDLETLKRQAEAVARVLESIRRRIDAIEKARAEA